MVKKYTYNLKRGDVWDGETFNILFDGFDFTGTTAKVQYRDKPDGTIYYTENPVVTYPSTGQMTFSITVPGSVTQTFPKKVLADVQISRTSPLFGPRTIYDFEIIVSPDITQ